LEHKPKWYFRNFKLLPKFFSIINPVMPLPSLLEFLWDQFLQNHSTTGNHSSKIRKNTTLEMAIVVYLTSSCVKWARVPKNPNLHTNELNTFFCSTSSLEAPSRLESLKLAWCFVLTGVDIYQNLFTHRKILKFWQCRTKKVLIQLLSFWESLFCVFFF
jgi:hypothetical protein